MAYWVKRIAAFSWIVLIHIMLVITVLPLLAIGMIWSFMLHCWEAAKAMFRDS